MSTLEVKIPDLLLKQVNEVAVKEQVSADFVARPSRIPADMLLARTSSAQRSLAAYVIAVMLMTTRLAR
jgi:hypothetical protein